MADTDPTPPTLAEQQLAATLALVAANSRLADVQQSMVTLQTETLASLKDPRFPVLSAASRMFAAALANQNGNADQAVIMAVQWAKELIAEVDDEIDGEG